MDDGNSDEKQKEQTFRPKFNDYTNCLLNNKPTLNQNKDLKVKHIMCLLQKITTSH